MKNNGSSRVSPTSQAERSLDRDERRFASQFLVASATSIASEAARVLTSQHPDTARRFGTMALDRWQENFVGRLADLAAAMMAGRSEVFTRQVQWSRVAFEARGVPTIDLERSLRALMLTLDRELPDEDKAPAMKALHDAIVQLQQPVANPPSEITTSTTQGTLAARYLLAILEGDRQLASDIVLGAVKAGAPPQDMYEHVLMPVQVELGRMWHLSELTVAEEHFATATSKLVMSQLLPMLPKQPRNGKVLLAASVEGNAHDLGVQMVTDFFEMAGFRSVFLGPSVPAADLVTAIAHFSCHVVALSAALPTQLRSAEDTIQGIRDSDDANVRATKVIVGGPAFMHTGDLWSEMGADALCNSPSDAVASGKRLLGL